MLMIIVKLVFTLATLLFAWGYTLRQSNNSLHRRLMLLGFLTTLTIAVVLMVGVHGLGLGYAPAAWLVRMAGGVEGAGMVLVMHRIFATLTLLLLIAQIIAGMRRHPVHGKLARIVIPCWLVTYFSGLSVFI